jgi:putative DNA primase/helicase
MRSAAWDAWVAKARSVDILDVARKRPDLKLKSGRGGKELTGPCPQCGGDDRFAVTGTAKKKVFNCRGCGKSGDVIELVKLLDGCDFERAVEKLTGETKPKPERKRGKANGKLGNVSAEYPYTDEAGKLTFEVVRYEPKDFRQRRPDKSERSGWAWNLDGVRLVPYRLPQLRAAIKAGQIVLVVEGEKDVATAETLDHVATCAPGGVGMGWRDQYDAHFSGADVVIIPDNDKDENKGPRYARSIAGHLLKVARRVRWLMLDAKDLTAWVEAGGTREQLARLIIDAPVYAPQGGEAEAEGAQQETSQTEAPANGIDDDAEIAKLALMSPLDYERARKDAGKRLGISRLSMLDALVKTKRAELGLDGDDGKQGHAIAFPEPEPWPEPVDGARLLDGLAKATRDHVVMSDAARDEAALWVLHAHMIDCFLVSPRLGVTSPVKGCGKTTLLDVLGRLLPRPLPTANVTPAALFRVVEGYQPTLLVDEADTFLHDNDELRGVLNSGHRKGGTVLRTVGDDHEPRAFKTFCPTVIALIGTLPDTLHDRAVTIDLKRKLRTESVAPFRPDRADHLDLLARKAARWAQDNAEAIASADPEMPDGIINREADNWRPLLAIADAAGGAWPERARKAAEAAHIAAGDDKASRLELLLHDIRVIFTEQGKVEIPSADLVRGLVNLDGHPWGEMGKSRKPLTTNGLSSRLRPLAIISENIRVGDRVPKGYKLARFEEAFSRYLPPEGASEPLHRYNPDEMGTSEPYQTATPDPDVAVRKCEKSANDGPRSGVADEKGEMRGKTPVGSRFGAQERTRWGVTFTVLGHAQPGTRCLYCEDPTPDDEGPVMVVNGAGPLHEACAPAWITNQDRSR